MDISVCTWEFHLQGLFCLFDNCADCHENRCVDSHRQFQFREYAFAVPQSIISATQYSIEIIVVDNHSHDNSLSLIDHLDYPVHIIRNAYNAGFPNACNQGIEAAAGGLILLLNPYVRRRPAPFRC